MSDENAIDFDKLVEDCYILSDKSAQDIEYSIDCLAENYTNSELVLIYNHFLSVAKNQDLLMYLVRCIDRFRDKSSISPILDLFLDRGNSLNLRVMCAKELANFKDTSVVTPLLYSLNDKSENYKLRLACADSLGRVGDKYAVSPLIDIVGDEEEKSVYVRESAAVALGMLGDIRAIEPLVKILESKKGFMDKFSFLKERIIEVLGKFHSSDDNVIRAMEHALKDDSSTIRINAIEVLMESDSPRALPMIKKMLNDYDDEVKKNALIAMYNIVGREILDEVIESSDYSEFLKEEAKDLIAEYEDCEDE